MAKNQNRPQIETTLAYMAVGVIGASIVSMLLTLGLSALGFTSFPVLLAQLPLVGLPIGFLIIVAMLVVSIIRRTKENEN
jgi:CBS domain containing-hemolysin-like protein